MDIQGLTEFWGEGAFLSYLVFLYILALAKQEVKMTQDLLESALCREDDVLRDKTERWNYKAQLVERLVQEVVSVWFITSGATCTEQNNPR